MHHFLELTDHFYVSLSSNSYMSISLGSVSGDVVCSFWGSHFPFLVFQNFALASKDLGKKKKNNRQFFQSLCTGLLQGKTLTNQPNQRSLGPVKLLGGGVHLLWAFTYNFSIRESCQLLIHELFISCSLWCLSLALQIIWFYNRNRWGDSGNSVRLYFGGLKNHCRW